jgi:hypothetical protein
MRPLLAAAVSLAVVLGLAAVVPAARQRGPTRRGPALVLRGSVAGLYPGARLPLRVRIRNRQPFAVRVLAVRARVSGRGRRGCARSNVAVSPRPLRLRVPARRARTALLRVTMRRGAPDACKGAVFRLAFSARGTRA